MLRNPVITFVATLAAVLLVTFIVVKPAFDAWEINHSFPYNECSMRKCR